MENQIFQQLLEVELSLQKAQELLDAEYNSTELLQSHVALLSAHANFSKTFENDSEEHLLSIEEIKDLLNLSKPTNLSDYCSACHQSFYESDKDASNGKYKANLQKCCLNSINLKKDDLEISFWWYFIKNFNICVSILPNYTKLMMKQGIPSNLRSLVWGLLSLSSNSENKIIDEDISRKLYQSLNVDISEDIKIISNDVNRTFPQLSTLTADETKSEFERILNAFSVYNFDIGYCQGLQFVVAPLLFHFQEDDQIKTFNSLVNLFDINPFLKKIYNDEMTNLNVLFYKFEKIFKKNHPELFNHFKSLELDSKIFLSQWFLSLYAVTIPFHFLIRMFDILLLEGVEATLLRSGLIILEKNENLLLQIDDSEVIYQHLLSENCWGVFGNNCDEFISQMLELPVNDFTVENLESLENEFNKKSSNEKSYGLPNVAKSFNRFLNGLGSKFPSSSSSSSISSSNVDSDAESIQSSTLFSIKNNSTFSLNTESSSSNNEKSINPAVNMKRSSKFQLLKIVDDSKPVMLKPIHSNNNDLELIKQMYELCLANGITDSIMDKAKQRIGRSQSYSI